MKRKNLNDSKALLNFNALIDKSIFYFMLGNSIDEKNIIKRRRLI